MAQKQSIETISEIVVQKNVDYNAEKDLKKQFQNATNDDEFNELKKCLFVFLLILCFMIFFLFFFEFFHGLN